MLALQSRLLSELISSVPCCTTTALSLPFNSVVVKNLLAIISCGVSLPLSRDDLLNVKVVADMLDITLGQLEVEKSDVKMTKKARVKKKILREHISPSPKPYLENDYDNDSDEIVEITPEIFDGNSEDTIPAHFLMQVSLNRITVSMYLTVFVFILDGVSRGLKLRNICWPVGAGADRAAARRERREEI